MHQQVKGLLWLAAAGALAVGLLYGIPLAARHVPWRVEGWLGRAAGGIPGAPCGEGKTEETVALHKLVQRIFPIYPDDIDVPVRVSVLRGPTVNAFATLGGRIYVFDGLIQQAESPEELAGILAHEIEHVRNRHIIQGAIVNLGTAKALELIFTGGSNADLTGLLLNLRFTREEEYEADDKGLQRLRQAKVDAAGLGRFFERMRAKGQGGDSIALLSSHPPDELRAQLVAHYAGYAAKPVMDAAEWRELKAICK